MSTQTEAERLAIALTEHVEYYGDGFSEEQGCLAAAELRRLVSLNNDLMDEVARLTELAEQPAQQEPVAWMTQARNFVHLMEFTEAEAKLYGWKAVYTTPQAQPAPEVATDWERVARAQNAKLMAMCNQPGGMDKLREVLLAASPQAQPKENT